MLCISFIPYSYSLVLILFAVVKKPSSLLCYKLCTIDHNPHDYRHPFCDWLAGNETEHKKNSDIVFQDSMITVFISPKWWVNNPGHVIIIPNRHVENIYDIPDELLTAVYITAKRIAIAMRKSYSCDGTSTRQHNEPAGNQDVWHFHTHLFPRYEMTNFIKTTK